MLCLQFRRHMQKLKIWLPMSSDGKKRKRIVKRKELLIQRRNVNMIKSSQNVLDYSYVGTSFTLTFLS